MFELIERSTGETKNVYSVKSMKNRVEFLIRTNEFGFVWKDSGDFVEGRARTKDTQGNVMTIKEMIQTLNSQQDQIKKLNQLIGDMISLNLWSARRLHEAHKGFAYDELERVTGEEYERL